MERPRKITVEILPELLEKAQRVSGTGITQTVRTGLQLVAARRRMRSCGDFVERLASPGAPPTSKSIDDGSSD
jgi:hypothetical protein